MQFLRATAIAVLMSAAVADPASAAEPGNWDKAAAKQWAEDRGERRVAIAAVPDGDTIDVRDFSCRPPVDCPVVRVRLSGPDAPELAQPWGTRARDALAAKLAAAGEIRLEPLGPLSYGRVIGRLTADGADIGRWLVGNGHAWAYDRYPEGRALLPEQGRAMAAGKGMWGAAGEKIRPELWRRDHPHRRDGEDASNVQ